MAKDEFRYKFYNKIDGKTKKGEKPLGKKGTWKPMQIASLN